MGRSVSPSLHVIPLLTEHSFSQLRSPPPPTSTCIQLIWHLRFIHVSQFPFLSRLLFQTHCGHNLTCINHNHSQPNFRLLLICVDEDTVKLHKVVKQGINLGLVLTHTRHQLVALPCLAGFKSINDTLRQSSFTMWWLTFNSTAFKFNIRNIM